MALLDDILTRIRSLPQQVGALDELVRQGMQDSRNPVVRGVQALGRTSLYDILPGGQTTANLYRQANLPQPTVGGYLTGQLYRPFKQGLTALNRPDAAPEERAIGAVQATIAPLSLTPAGFLYNLGAGGIAGGLRSLRTGEPYAESVTRGVETPSGVASTGLGLDGIAGLIGDLAAANPRQALRLLRTGPSAVKSAGTKLNTSRLNVGKQARDFLDKTVAGAQPDIQARVGPKLTNKEIIGRAAISTDQAIGAIGRQTTAKLGAAQLRLRQTIAELADKGTVTKDLLQKLRADLAFAANNARLTQQRAIQADPTTPAGRIMASFLQDILKINDDLDGILAKAKDVDFADPKAAAAFYREFVKPSAGEWADTLRYNSMLSSPITQLVNIQGNVQGTGILEPVQKTAEGLVDALASAFKPGRTRTRFTGEGAVYLGGYLASGKQAWQAFFDTLKGARPLDGPDYQRQIPLAVKGPAKVVESVLDTPGKVQEAIDQFFLALTTGGLSRSTAYRKARLPDGRSVDIAAEAKNQLFRGELTSPGEGAVASFIGAGGRFVRQATFSENFGVRWLAKLTLPFLTIGTNLAKAGVAYNPLLGALNYRGNADPVAQTAKIAIGSVATLIGAGLALADRITFGEPASEKQRNARRAANIPPYAIKIGDTWVQYSKWHPAIAFQLATVAALTDAVKTQKLDEDAASAIAEGAWNGLKFIADQTYFKNVGDFVKTMEGDVDGVARLAANYPAQAIPFRALASWLNNMIDTYQRVPSKDADLATKALQSVMAQLPGLSHLVPARLGPDGQPIERSSHPFLNAFSPTRIETEDPQMAAVARQLAEDARIPSGSSTASLYQTGAEARRSASGATVGSRPTANQQRALIARVRQQASVKRTTAPRTVATKPVSLKRRQLASRTVRPVKRLSERELEALRRTA